MGKVKSPDAEQLSVGLHIRITEQLSEKLRIRSHKLRLKPGELARDILAEALKRVRVTT